MPRRRAARPALCVRELWLGMATPPRLTSVLEGHLRWQGETHGLGDDDVFRQAATPAGQADEAQLIAGHGGAALAGEAGGALEHGHDGDLLPDNEAVDAVTYLVDDAGELMAEGDGHDLVGDGMRVTCLRGKAGPAWPPCQHACR